MDEKQEPDSPATSSDGRALSDEERRTYIQIWEKAVDTQMHFNEMSVKSRQLGLTFVAGALGVGVVLLSRGNEFALTFPVGGRTLDIHVAALIVLAAALALMAVKILDLQVYHKMLRGAVTFGEDIEQVYMRSIFDLEKGMTQAISHFSRHEDARVTVKGGRYVYTGSGRQNAELKLKKFYNVSISVLLVLSLALVIATNFTLSEGSGVAEGSAAVRGSAAQVQEAPTREVGDE